MGFLKRNWWVDTDSGWYFKKSYDFSKDLENRVKQLVKTITGKELKLAKADGWGTDKQYFYYNPKDLEDATDDEVLGRIIHQLGREYTIETKKLELTQTKEPAYKHLLEILEDSRADAVIQADYPGSRYYADELWAYKKETGIGDKREKEKSIDALDFCNAITALQNGETTFAFHNQKVADNFQKAIPDIKNYLASRTFREALGDYERIKKYYPTPKNQQEQEEMDQQTKKQHGLSEQEKKKAAKAAGSQPIENEAADLADEWLKLNGKISTYTKEQLVDIFKEKLKEQHQGFQQGSLDDGTFNSQRSLDKYYKVAGEYGPIISTLHRLIQSVLTDNEAKRFVRPFKRGKLDQKAIHKYLATDNLRIFKKPKGISEKRYNMTILVDQSGSMQGQRGQYAMEATIALAEVFERLKLPYQVHGFHSTTFEYKGFNTPLKRDLIANSDFDGGGTNDVHAMEMVRKTLKKLPNNYKNGVFVITDGDGNDRNRMKNLVTEVEKENTVVFGIGIGGVSPESMAASYNHYLMVDNVKELPKTLVELMKTQFRRN